jgi:hypothetical protein
MPDVVEVKEEMQINNEGEVTFDMKNRYPDAITKQIPVGNNGLSSDDV